jgi:hypothetical protein
MEWMLQSMARLVLVVGAALQLEVSRDASIARVGMPQSPSPEMRKALYSSAKPSSYKQCTARLHHVDIPVEIRMEAVLSGLRWPSHVEVAWDDDEERVVCTVDFSGVSAIALFVPDCAHLDAKVHVHATPAHES